jgi:hypothetical protein
LKAKGAVIKTTVEFSGISIRPFCRVWAVGLTLFLLVSFGFSLPGWTQERQPATSQGEPAQTALGSISGVVVDRDGAVYEGAHVAVSSVGAGVAPERTATTDSTGRFSFDGLPAGSYKLTISSNGFAAQVKSIVLNAGQSYEAPPTTLLVTTAASEVRVTASTEELAQVDVEQEEKQRVLGFVPNFYVVYDQNAPPLNKRQKFDLAWKTSIDWTSWVASGAFAGVQQASNSFSGYGQGAQGYAKRFGANFTDDFVANYVGNAILPSLLKQDPRYFYKGTGTIRHRALYAIANAVICKGDNGHWQPAYSGIIGGLASGGISNLYYPASNRQGAALTFETAGYDTIGSAVQNLLQEFVVKRFTPKLPSYGTQKP